MRSGHAEWELGWYLVALRRALARALDARRAWVPELRSMLGHAAQGDTLALVAAAGSIGARHGSTFRCCRDMLDALSPPSGWASCHETARAWFDEVVAACEALDAVGRSGDAGALRLANDHVLAAGDLAARFNDEYARLSAPVRGDGPVLDAPAAFETRL